MSKKEKSKPPSALTSEPSKRPSADKSSPSKKPGARNRSTDVAKRPAELAAAKSPPPKLRRHRRRVRLGEGMRKYGLDEHTIAETYAGVVQTLRSRSEGEGIEKLLVDVLKECTRVLEPPAKASDRSGGETLVQVQLVHNVPRPERKALPQLPAGVRSATDRLPKAALPGADEPDATVADFTPE